jgi:hypothetical protein
LGYCLFDIAHCFLCGYKSDTNCNRIKHFKDLCPVLR